MATKPTREWKAMDRSQVVVPGRRAARGQARLSASRPRSGRGLHLEPAAEEVDWLIIDNALPDTAFFDLIGRIDALDNDTQAIFIEALDQFSTNTQVPTRRYRVDTVPATQYVRHNTHYASNTLTGYTATTSTQSALVVDQVVYMRVAASPEGLRAQQIVIGDPIPLPLFQSRVDSNVSIP